MPVRAAHLDVLIIGGGVIGLSIARELRKLGVARLAVVDRGPVGKEASFAAAGMLLPHAETDKPDLFYRFCLESFSLYETFAGELLKETGIDIELNRQGTLYTAFDQTVAAEIGRRYTWQHNAGVSVERLTRSEILALEPHISPNVIEGLFFPNDWHVENRKLLSALERYAVLNEISIVQDCEIREITADATGMTGATSAKRKFSAENIVIATGASKSFINIGGLRLPFVVKPIKGQMICFKPDAKMLDKIVFGPDCYLVPRSDGRILAGATVEDVGFDKNVTPEAVKSLRNAVSKLAPSIGRLDVADSWSGLRPMSADGLPILGGIDGVAGVTIATAHFRNGILLAPLTARLIADFIIGNTTSEYLPAFGTSRFSTSIAAPA